MQIAFVAVASVLLAAASQGAITRIGWRVVNNTVGNPGSDPFAGAQWNAMDQYTFDLVGRGTTGTTVTSVNLGDPNNPTASNYFLQCNGVTFHHPLGGDFDPAAPLPFSAAPYDTFGDLGSADSATLTAQTAIDLFTDGVTDFEMRGTWTSASPISLNASNEVRFMRVTAGFAPGFNPYTIIINPTYPTGIPQGFLGTPWLAGAITGQAASTIRIGYGDGTFEDFIVGNAFFVPAPGGGALLLAGAVAGVKRRRR